MYAITPRDRAIALEYGEQEFIGKAIKKWRGRRAEKREDRQAHKLEKIEARGNAKATARQAGPGFFDRALDTVGGFLTGGGQAAELPMPTGIQGSANMDVPPQPPAKKNNNAIIIGGVVLLVVIVGAIIYMRSSNS